MQHRNRKREVKRGRSRTHFFEDLERSLEAESAEIDFEDERIFWIVAEEEEEEEDEEEEEEEEEDEEDEEDEEEGVRGEGERESPEPSKEGLSLPLRDR